MKHSIQLSFTKGYYCCQGRISKDLQPFVSLQVNLKGAFLVIVKEISNETIISHAGCIKNLQCAAYELRHFSPLQTVIFLDLEKVVRVGAPKHSQKWRAPCSCLPAWSLVVEHRADRFREQQFFQANPHRLPGAMADHNLMKLIEDPGICSFWLVYPLIQNVLLQGSFGDLFLNSLNLDANQSSK